MGTYGYSHSPVFLTVGTTGTYDITGYGAQGGGGGDGTAGGLGAEESGFFNLTAGEHLEIIVGASGKAGLATSNGRYAASIGGGGGGGVFVRANIGANGAYVPLLVAGGGGGGYGTQGQAGQVTSGTGASGTKGYSNSGGGSGVYGGPGPVQTGATLPATTAAEMAPAARAT